MALGQQGSSLTRRAAILGVAALLGVVGMVGSEAQDAATSGVELHILQRVRSPSFILVNASAAGDSWEPSESTHLPLDDGFSSSGRYRYGDIALEVPLRNGAYVTVETRVWLDVQDGRTLFISARPASGSWKPFGTRELTLEEGHFDNFSYGAVQFQVPIPGSKALEACTASVAVPDPDDNPGLVRDCVALFQSGPTLAGKGGRDGKALTNWRADVPLSKWYGVTVGGTPARVTGLEVQYRWSESRNVLRGRIPPELALLSKLEVLDLSDHRELKGTIPPELGSLVNLKTLDLSGNQLTGPVPRELGALSNLEFLRLGQNQLTGTIPRELGQLGELRHLSLGSRQYIGNRLTGEIPQEIGELANLELLDLSKNLLTGSIPPELGNLYRLRHLSLNDNELTGAIPPELGTLVRINAMDLSNNQLTGGIPPEFGQMRNPELLNLRNNGLSGEIPAELADAFEGPYGLLLAGNPWESCLPVALRPLVDDDLVGQLGGVTAASDEPPGSDLNSLGLSYCQCLPPLQSGGPSPDLRVGVDGIPFLPQKPTSVPGTYRLTFSLVLDLPPGGAFRLQNWRTGPYVNGGFAGAAITVTLSELRTGSDLLMDPFTGYVYGRHLVDEPSDCEGAPSRLFDQIVASMRNQPPYSPPSPENIVNPDDVETLEGGRSYWLNETLSLIFDVPDLPEGTSIGGYLTCFDWDEDGCYQTLEVGGKGSQLFLRAGTGQAWHWNAGKGELDAVLTHIADSVRQHLPPPSCEAPETAPDCSVLLGARDTLAGDAHLNWDARLPLPYWQGVTVDRRTGRVVNIDVGGGVKLNGQIPQELSQLTHLETLDLSFNRLTGSIPPELGELPNLRELDLHFNRLQGCISEALWRFDIANWQTSNPNLRRCDEGSRPSTGP
jgi:hypothetical protein